jgi:putative methanogenesis marker protein 6
MVYESKYGAKVKETCFGAVIEGEEQPIKSLVEEIRALDPSGIFIKDRGFPLGDPSHCRGSIFSSSYRMVSTVSGCRSGSARPGCYMIEAESKILPLISKALASMAKVDLETDMTSEPIGNRPRSAKHAIP